MTNRPSTAFIGLSWLALAVGMLSYLVGLWNATLLLSEKGYYLSVFLFGLFAAVSVQKSVRDQLEGVPVTSLYYALSWLAAGISVVLLVVGLWNSSLALSERGFYGIAFVLSLFAAIVVQKNTRDSAAAEPKVDAAPPPFKADDFRVSGE